jgi:hypothetical protein
MARPKRDDAGAKNFIHFRADDDLMDLLDNGARGLGVSRSQYARTLILTGLHTPATITASKEAIYTFSGVVRRVVKRLSADLIERLPAVLEEELTVVGDEK